MDIQVNETGEIVISFDGQVIASNIPTSEG